jgi:hypothetical protein
MRIVNDPAAALSNALGNKLRAIAWSAEQRRRKMAINPTDPRQIGQQMP